MALFGQGSPRDDERALAWRLWMSRRNPYAIASLVLGIFSFIELGANLVFGIAGCVVGVIALTQLRRASEAPAQSVPEPTEGHRLAWAGIILSVISLAIAVALYCWPLFRR